MDYCETLELPAPAPSTVLCDFELSVIRSLSIVLHPDVSIRGCFYHLTQATWRKIQELGLSHRYSDDEEFKLFCGKLDGLAFLPPNDVPAGMEYLLQNTPEGAEELTDYFNDIRHGFISPSPTSARSDLSSFPACSPTVST